jgi:hypothetical protein
MRGSGKLIFVALGMMAAMQCLAEQVTRQEMHQPLRLSINGVLVSTATIQTVIKGPGLMISVPREIAGNLLPTLLEPPAT